MSIVGWARIIAGGTLIAFAIYFVGIWDIGQLTFWNERVEYFGYGFDDAHFVLIPVRFLFVMTMLILGYRLLRKAEVVATK